MLRRRQITAESSARWLRSLLAAAAGALRRVTRAAEDGIWRGIARLADVADVARWPFERLAWTAERRLLWPLRERAAGWDPPRRTAGAGALVAVAAGASLIGILLARGGGEATPPQVAVPTRVALATKPPKAAPQEPKGPALQGAQPSFGVGGGVGVAGNASSRSGDAVDTGSAAPDAGTAPEGGGDATAGAGAAATSSKAKPVPAGPAAMKVARRFAEAFVFYEIGKRPQRAKTVFGETATPQLAEALADRPPRLPESARVPKARVVNLVPGPRLGRAYTVSVSLLRLGLTSELRISLQHSKADGWKVSEILG